MTMTMMMAAVAVAMMAAMVAAVAVTMMTMMAAVAVTMMAAMAAMMTVMAAVTMTMTMTMTMAMTVRGYGVTGPTVSDIALGARSMRGRSLAIFLVQLSVAGDDASDCRTDTWRRIAVA